MQHWIAENLNIIIMGDFKRERKMARKMHNKTFVWNSFLCKKNSKFPLSQFYSHSFRWILLIALEFLLKNLCSCINKIPFRFNIAEAQEEERENLLENSDNIAEKSRKAAKKKKLINFVVFFAFLKKRGVRVVNNDEGSKSKKWNVPTQIIFNAKTFVYYVDFI